MSDKLDNDLKNRIREVFDNYEDDTADAGWDLLRQKFPAEEKKRRIIAWWWYSAAAILLLCLGTWFFYPQAPQQVAQVKKTNPDAKHTATNIGEDIAVNKASSGTPKQNTSTTAEQSISGADKSQANTITGTPTSDKKVAAVLSASNTALSNEPSNSLKEPVTTQLMANATVHTRNNNKRTIHQPKELNKGFTVAAIPKQANTATLSGSGASLQADRTTQNMAKVRQPTIVSSSNIADADSITNNNTAKVAAAQSPVKTTQPAATQTKTDAVLKMIAADDARRAVIAKNAVKKNETVKSDRAMILSLYAATYFNYAKGSENQLNVGGGFTSDIKIAGNFKLSTGLSIGQNRLSYSSDNTIPPQINSRALAMVNKSSAAASVNSYSLIASSLRSAGPELQNYNANLVGIDIPLNIKYQFNPKKNDTYISAGISSGTYINETYRSTYSYGNSYNSAAYSTTLNSVNAAAQQSQENTSTTHFGSFDFAKTLNVSFGLGYPLGKNRLVIEPFLKYPLNGLGTQDIKFGASGVNLKLSFSTSKK